MVTQLILRLTFAALFSGIAGSAWATGEFTQDIRFFSRSGMGVESDLSYFRGGLGIIRPTFDNNRLFAAYRLMMGGTFTDAQAQQLLARCCDAPGNNDTGTTTWSDARKRIPNLPSVPINDARRERPPEIAPYDVSCFPNAYRNAAATLLQRIKDHGAGDPSVREWVIGQDAVFANCATDSPPPAEISDAPIWLKADRAYQIANAYFYRLGYAHAVDLYAAIASDAGSPWSKLAHYLAARAAVHAAIVAKTPESIATATKRLAAIETESNLADYRGDARKLSSMLAFATEPRQRAEELAKSLLSPDLPASLSFDVHDLVDLARTGKRYTDVGAWIYDINALNGDKGQQNADVKADVLERWRKGGALPWLTAAMMFLTADDANTSDAIAASRAVEASSPAYYTLAWHRLRLLIDQGKGDEARTELDRLLAAPTLPEGVGNLMRYQRLKLARNVREFATFAVRRGEFIMYLYNPRTELSAWPLPLPATKWSESDIASVLGWRTELYQKDPSYFDVDASYGMSSFMPLPMMMQVVQSAGLPANIKRDVSLAVWTRAVLLDDGETATAMTNIVAPLFPQHAEGWKAYRGAQTPAAKKVEAALLLLKLPAAMPYVPSGLGYAYKSDVIGSIGPRWWAATDTPFGNADDSGNPMLCSDCALPAPLVAPAFVTDEDKKRAAADNKRLGALPGAPAWLGSVILPWAKTHLGDPRVPEALYNVVRATHYGDMDSDTSKAAYNLLHSRFPRNPWTAKTPYWY